MWAGRGGSSPRMRGKQGQASQLQVQDGLIPAYAGKTKKVALDRAFAPAHPRVCGENWSRSSSSTPASGSSPRMRGKRHCVDLPWFWPGLIPAYAGKTESGR